MATEQSTQQQHAQWLASLASEHFVQRAIGSVTEEDVNQQESPQVPENDPHIVDMSGHTVVKLISDPVVPPVPQPTSSSPFNLRKNLKKRKIDSEETERNAEYKLIRPKERISAKSFEMRRPVRPIDRQKMRPWLKNLLDTGSVFGLNWLHRGEGIFQISWRHASRLGWNLETDGDVFERWARHTGIFKDGDEPEPKRWKANFRCALHSLPDVKELTSPTDRKGRNASRTYRFLRPDEVQPPVKRKQRYSIQIPYLYDHTTEDSVSQQADSDDRNTDDEVMVLPDAQLFPHCDHDYAIRSEKQRGDQPTSEILSRHNSGYVLIKSKDAHEFEFRLTPPQTQGNVQASGAKSSPQKKGKGTKKKPTPNSSPSKKGKGKVGKKVIAARKDVKYVKKIKKSSGKEPSPATKVSLRALLSGRKNTAGSRRAKGNQAAGQSSKKAKGGKKAAAKERREQDRAGSGAGTPTQSQGLEALLEAANQLEGMDSQAPSSSSAVTSTAVTQDVSKCSVAESSVAATLSSAAATTAVSATGQPVATNITTPVVFTTKPMLVADGTAGPTLTPVPVLASVQSTATPAVVPSQESLTMLQKFLGLSAVSAVPTVPVSVPLLTMPAPSHAQTKTDATSAGSQILQDSKSAGDVLGQQAKTVAQVSPALPTLLVQPEEGTSMLKHLLQLTVPPGSVAIGSTSNSASASHIIPAAPKVPPPLFPIPASVGLKQQESNLTITAGIQSESIISGTAIGEDNKAYQSLEETKLGSTLEESEGVSSDSCQIYLRPEGNFIHAPEALVGSEVTALEESWSGNSITINSAQSHPNVSTPPAVVSLDLSQSTDGTQAKQPSPQVFTQTSSLPSVTAPVQQVSSTGPQVTLCLPQTLSGVHSSQLFGGGNQTMTLTLPQTSVPAAFGQGGSATFTHSMDLLQFLNLCAASGNGQVIIKTEPPVSSDVSAMSNAYSSEKTAPSSQPEGNASAGAKFVLLNSNMQAPVTSSAGSQLEMTGQEETQLRPLSASENSVLSATDGLHAFSAVQNYSTPADSNTLAAVESLGHSAMEVDSVPEVSVNTLPANETPLEQIMEEEVQMEVGSAGVMDRQSHQLTVTEDGMTSLSGHSDTDCFVVEDVL